MSAHQQSRHHQRGGIEPVSLLCQLFAIAVTILVIVPSLRGSNIQSSNNNNGASTTTSCNTGKDALGFNGWEIEPLPIMKKDAKSRGFHPVFVYAKVNLTDAERRDRYAKEGRDALILALTEANDGKNSTYAKMIRTNKKNGETDTGRKRYFVDLAAADPIENSETFLLERNGWDGICIEPDHNHWYRLAAYRMCTIIGAVVGGSPGDDGKLAPVDFDTEQRNMVSLLTVLRETNAPNVIDYLSLDEGKGRSVLKDFPWDSYAFRFINVAKPAEDLKTALGTNGYEHMKTFSSDDVSLWVNKKLVSLSKQEIDKISQKENVLLKKG